MSVRMRHTRGHTNNRRSHHALDAIKTVAGAKEGARRLPHRIDETTGLYRGNQIAQPAKAKKTEAQKHDHPHGTHHEHLPAQAGVHDSSTIQGSQTAGEKPGESEPEPRENL